MPSPKNILSSIKPQSETLINIGIGAIIIFVKVVIGYYIAQSSGRSYSFSLFIDDLVPTIPFIGLLIVSNLWLAPRLIASKKKLGYVLSSIFLVAATVATSLSINPGVALDGPEGPPEMMRPMDNDLRLGPPRDMPKGENRPPRFDDDDEDSDFRPGDGNLPPLPGDPPTSPPGEIRSLGPVLNNILMRSLIAMFIIILNTSVKQLFRTQHYRDRLKTLEHQNVQTELAFLKYQMNPHFFMNTLNNIHSLVDIDAELAKETIVELSRLMRYMLYESDQKLISLDKEVQFLHNFVQIMRIRYPKEVKINIETPSNCSGIMIPPLLFIPFLENAFKHGVSYRKKSYIDVSLVTTSEHIEFTCVNSIHKHATDDTRHGVGLPNIEKRLRLIYGNNYILRIKEIANTYEVKMILPAKVDLPKELEGEKT